MNSIGRKYDHDRIRQVAARRLGEGASVQVIARETGAPVDACYRVIKADLELHHMLLNKPLDDRKLMTSLGVNIGAVRPVLSKQSEEFRRWAIHQAADAKVSVAEFLISCTLDTFHDETEQEKAA